MTPQLQGNTWVAGAHSSSLELAAPWRHPEIRGRLRTGPARLPAASRRASPAARTYPDGAAAPARRAAWAARDPGADHRSGLGKDVFVDVDASINSAVRKIRQVLKDDAERPRFLQTVTGRGYRFIAPVLEDEPAPAIEAGGRTCRRRRHRRRNTEEPCAWAPSSR